MFPYQRMPSHITGLYIFSVANFLILCHITLVKGDITVISLKTNQTVDPDIPDMPAYFGRQIPSDGIWGQVVYANPANACSPIDPPPNISAVNLPELKWFVLIMRFGCNFSKKVLYAQEAGFDAAIVHNVGSNQLEPMGPDKETGILIPSVFIGESDGLRIKNWYIYSMGYLLYMNNEIPDIFWSIDLDKYLLPFACMLAVCFLATMSTMVIKCIRDRRQRQRHRLPAKLLKRLPIKKFKKEDHYDICAICLDDYMEGEKLRVLPCSHTYHTKCIDPWLTESRRTCPVCKRKVLPRGDGSRTISDSDSDEEGGESSNGGMLFPNENTPLLASSGGNINRVSSDVTVPNIQCHSNPALLVERDNLEELSEQQISQLATSGSSSSSSSGGWYQSFATPHESFSTSTPLPSSYRNESLLAVPVNVDILSSGEHSVNGECEDFTPIEARYFEEMSGGQGPVEIAIDVGCQSTVPFLSSALMPSSSSFSSSRSSQSSSESPKRKNRRTRGKRKRPSNVNHDMVV